MEMTEKYQQIFEQAITENNIDALNQAIAETKENVEFCLAKAYGRMKLLNMPINENTENYVMEKLVSLRFFCEKNDDNSREVPITLDDVTERIDRLIKLIEKFTTKFLGATLVKNMFVYWCQLIAKHLHILKYQLKSTYDKLPWAEMEFCLVTLVENIVRPQDSDDIFKLVLHRNRVLQHLSNFKTGLLKLKTELKSKFIGRKLRLGSRNQMIHSVLTFMPEFEQLYRDYDLIKDVSSLRRIDHYISICCNLTFDDNKEHDRLVIERTLQVIGETLKSSPDSPNISEDLQKMLVDSAPQNLKEIITSLRDSLSHTESLPQKVEMENYGALGFFESIRDDLVKIHIEIVYILYKRRLKALEMFTENVLNCRNQSELQYLVESIGDVSFRNMDTCDIFLKDLFKIEQMIEELLDLIGDVTAEERMLFEEVQMIIDGKKNKLTTSVTKYNTFTKSVRFALSQMKAGKNLEHIQEIFGMISAVLCSSDESSKLYRIGEPILKIHRSVKCRMCFEYGDRIEQIFNDILDLATVKSVRLGDIGKFKSNLGKSELATIKHRKYIDSLLEKVEKSLKTEMERNSFRKAVSSKEDTYKIRFELLKLIDDKIARLTETEADETFIALVQSLKMRKQNEDIFLENYINGAYEDCKDTIKKIDDPYGLLVKNMLDLDVFSYHKQQKALKVFLSSLKLKKLPLEDVMRAFIEQSENELQLFITERLSMLKTILSLPADVDAPSIISKIQKNESLKAITELIILDVMNILESAGFFVDDKLFFDDISPLMLGKSLRNYLAHGNNLVDILPFDGARTLACNTVTLIRECDGLLKRKNVLIGKKGSNQMWKSKFYLENLDELAIQNVFFATVQANIIENVLELVRQDANILWSRDFDNQTALHFAASCDSLQSLIFCVEFGLDEYAHDSFHHTPLDVAIKTGSARIFEHYLAKANANVDQDDIFILAVKFNQVGMLSKLLQMFHREISDESISEAISSASQLGYIDILELLLEKFGEDNRIIRKAYAIHGACFFGHKEIVTLLLSFNFNVNAMLPNGNLPIHSAISEGRCDIVELLLRNGAKLYSGEVEDKEETEAVQYGTGCNFSATHENFAEGKIATLFTAHMTELLAASIGNEFQDSLIEYPFPCIILTSMLGHIDILQILILHSADVNEIHQELTTALCAACALKRTEIVELLIRSGADVNLAPGKSGSPLHQASECGAIDIIHILLRNGANVNKTTKGNFTAAHCAALSGYSKVLEVLQSYGGELNLKSANGKTPLHIAVEEGHQNVIEFLLEKGEDVNAVDIYGYSPLHLANKTGDEHILEVLLKNGNTLVNLQDKEGNTPLHFAASYGHIRSVELLLNNGAKSDPVNSINASPLVYALERSFVSIAETLISHGADVNIVYSYTHSPLHLAVKNGLQDIVEKLLAKGACADVKDPTSVTPLHVASAYGYSSIANILLKSGANINEQTLDGYTPLYLACKNGFEGTIKVLLRNDADLNRGDIQGITPLHAACNSGHRRAVESLLANGASVSAVDAAGATPVHIAALNGHLDIVRVLHEHGSDVNSTTFSGESVLHMASESGSTAMVTYLLNSKVRIDVIDEEGFTALHVAAQKGHADVVRLLLAAGLHADVTSHDGIAPLHMAADGGNAAVVEALVEKGAKVDAVLDSGETALHVAAGCGNTEVVKVLLLKGASVSARDSDGWTVLDKALQAEHADVVDVLLFCTR